MCRRYKLKATLKQLEQSFAAEAGEHVPEGGVFTPGKIVPVVLTSRRTSRREIHPIRWGLIPNWTTEESQGAKSLYNARAETLMDKPSFRDSFFHRRCLIPATSFFEWQRESKRSIEILPTDREIFAFAGIWDRWQSPEGKMIATCSMITTEAGAATSSVHHRMPALLDESSFNDWLDPDYPASLVQALLLPSEQMRIQDDTMPTSPGKTREPELLLS